MEHRGAANTPLLQGVPLPACLIPRLHPHITPHSYLFALKTTRCEKGTGPRASREEPRAAHACARCEYDKAARPQPGTARAPRAACQIPVADVIWFFLITAGATEDLDSDVKGKGSGQGGRCLVKGENSGDGVSLRMGFPAYRCWKDLVGCYIYLSAVNLGYLGYKTRG